MPEIQVYEFIAGPLMLPAQLIKVIKYATTVADTECSRVMDGYLCAPARLPPGNRGYSYR